jgi:DnaJ-class molecular chaperone
MNAVTVCSKCKVAGLVQCDSAISCASCEGTGKVLDADRRDYHGIGEIQVSQKRVCPACHGLGKNA